MNKRKPGRILEGLPAYAIPADSLFDEYGKLIHTDAALSLWLYCCKLANKLRTDGRFTLDIEAAVAATGYSERQLWRALHTLLEPGEVDSSKPTGNRRLLVLIGGRKFSQSEYAIAGALGLPIYSHYLEEQKISLRELLFQNGFGYYDVPCHIVDHLKQLKGSPLSIALTGIRQALIWQSAKFTAVLKEWKDMAHIYKDEVLRSAWVNPKVHALMHVSHTKGHRTAEVELFNPEKGSTLADNKHEAAERAQERAMLSEYEAEQRRTFTPQELERWFLSEFPKAEYIDGEFYVDCPYCHGTGGGHKAPTPTLRVRFDGTPVGIMNCTAFIRRNRGDDITCNFDEKWKKLGHKSVPFYLVADKKGITPATAHKQMINFILNARGGAQ